MFGFFSKKINVKQVQQGRHLDKAVEQSIDFFMEKRLSNPPRKALVGIWLVFYEDASYVYWGEPVFRSLFSDKRVVDTLYKTNKKDVLSKYPNYQQDFYSVKIKHTVLDYINAFEEEKDGIQFQSFTFSDTPTIRRLGDYLEINAIGQILYTPNNYLEEAASEQQSSLVKYLILLHSISLELHSIKEQ